MGHSTDNPPLTSVQQCVVDALAAGSTLTDAAETYGVHRVTIYRWMKTSPALHRRPPPRPRRIRPRPP